MLYADLYLDLAKKGAKMMAENFTDETVKKNINTMIEAQVDWAKTVAEANWQLAVSVAEPFKDTSFGKLFQFDRYFK